MKKNLFLIGYFLVILTVEVFGQVNGIVGTEITNDKVSVTTREGLDASGNVITKTYTVTKAKTTSSNPISNGVDAIINAHGNQQISYAGYDELQETERDAYEKMYDANTKIRKLTYEEADLNAKNEENQKNKNQRKKDTAENAKNTIVNRFSPNSNKLTELNKEPIAYIGKSRVPIYKNPSDLVVNTQKEQPTPYEFTEEYQKHAEKIERMIEDYNKEKQLNYTDITLENIINKTDLKKINDAPWDEIYSSMNNHQRFATIIGLMNSVNQGLLPKYDKSSSTKNGHVFLGNNKCFVLSADGTSLVFYETSDKEGFDYLKPKGSALSLKFKDDLQREIQGPSIGVDFIRYDHYSEARLKYVKINDDGSISLGIHELASKVGPSGNVGVNLSINKAGASASAELASIKLTSSPATAPKMRINKDASVNFVQINPELSAKVTGGLGIGLKDNELKLLFLSIGVKFLNPDIDGAIKQINPNIAIKMITAYADDNKSLILPTKSQPNPQPTHSYDQRINVIDEIPLNQLKESISNISK